MYKDDRTIRWSMRRVVLMLMLLVGAALSAQEISVSSFRMLENDLTANTTGTIEHDQNGEVASLIKVVTPEQGFVFDGGMVGIVKTRQEVGEVWVYVPHGIKRINIRHPQLGVLRDYYFPIPIEKARTYEMKLTTGRVETIVTHTVNKQFVVFNVKPANAIVELDDEMLTVDSEGYAEKGVPYGTYSYRVSCANYYTEAGQVTVTGEQQAEVNVKLRPNFGWIQFDAAEELHGAHVYIDNVRVGQLPLVAEGGKPGEHRVKIVKPLYKTYTQQVTVAEGDTTVMDVEMVANFARVTVVSSDEQGEIWIDGQKKGVGRWVGGLETGEYQVEVRRESHRPVSDVLYINDLSERTFRMGAPVPVYTSVEIASRPSKATVYMDGKKIGETPLVKNSMLIGKHQVVFKKEGYLTVEKTVDLKENVENKVQTEMVKGQDAPVVDNTPQQPVQPQQPTVKKGAEWRFILGAGAGFSPYGLNYGGELGIGINRFALTIGAKGFPMGEYAAYASYDDYINGGTSESYKIDLMRFSASIGYTLSIGKHFKVTPQAGLVFDPSMLRGGDYLSGKVLTAYMPEYVFAADDYKVLDERIDYSEMNLNIINFAAMQYGFVLGARLELTTANSRFGLHVTPEYVINEGVAVNAGIVLKL